MYKHFRKMLIALCFSATLTAIFSGRGALDFVDKNGESNLVVQKNLTKKLAPITPMWFTFGPNLSNGDTNYAYVSSTSTERKFTSSPTVWPINAQVYFLIATDSTGVSRTLLPQHTLSYCDTSIIANDYVTVKVRDGAADGYTLPTGTYLYNESKKLNTISTDIRPAGNSSAVGTGKLMYRYGMYGGTYNSWAALNLFDPTGAEVSITINASQANCIQFAMIYTVYEPRIYWWQFIEGYYKIRGTFSVAVE